ncbi:MAG TPA: hypothetical protein DCS93_28115 [Microscillaceae bacterium]|nr:hypothetical protein [Microscillaceae bacterium]
MKTYIYLILLWLLPLLSIGQDFQLPVPKKPQPIRKIVRKSKRFKKAYEILVKHQVAIKKAMGVEKFNPVLYVEIPLIHFNRSDFEKLMQKTKINELNKVLRLWKEQLLPESVQKMAIMIYADYSVSFCVQRTAPDTYEHIDHHVIFGYKKEHKGFGQRANKILYLKKLKPGGVYLIEQRFWYED